MLEPKVGSRGNTQNIVTDALGRTSVVTYNITMQPISVSDKGNGSVTAISTSYTYDSKGRTSKETDSLGTSRTFDYDGKDRVTTAHYKNASGAEVLRTSYTYDKSDNVTTMLDYTVNGTTATLYRYTEFKYDRLKRLTSVTELNTNKAPTAITAAEKEAHTTKYTYDIDGNLLSVMYPQLDQSAGVNFTKKEAEQYFQWYLGQREERIEYLKDMVQQERKDVLFDYTPESLIKIWEWYEGKIVIEPRPLEEIEKERARELEWMQEYVPEEQLSLKTWDIAMDIAIYFAEVMVRNNASKVYWGYFTKPKNKVSVNMPVLLGFKDGVELDPRAIVVNCTRHSAEESNYNRLYEVYEIWLKYNE